MQNNEPSTRVTDLVVFRLKPGVRRDEFLGTVDAVSEWARAQAGFESRNLSYSETDDTWIEVVCWASATDADAAAIAEQSATECVPMFAAIDMENMQYVRAAAAIEPVTA